MGLCLLNDYSSLKCIFGVNYVDWTQSDHVMWSVVVSYSVQLYMYISQICELFTKKIAGSYLLTCEIVIWSLTQDHMSVSLDVACKSYQSKQFVVDS